METLKQTAGSAAGTAGLEELAAVNDARASQYGLLARLFRDEVDAALLDELRAARFPAKTGSPLVDAGNRRIAAYVGGAWADPVLDLARDYVHVFVGAGMDGHAAAYPFESVYTSEKRLLMQDARDEVRAVYRANGIDRKDSWREGEDHVALELEFMQVMARRTAEALRAGDEDAAEGLLRTQAGFLNDHLASWTPLFAADMRRRARTDFYRGLADVLEGTLLVDAEFLAGVVPA